MSKKAVRAASWVSVIVSTAILLLKILAYNFTNSQALLTDALESIVNVIAAGVSWYLLKEALAPADSEHPYGHGKMENLAAAFEGGLVTLASIAVFMESIKALVAGSSLVLNQWGLITALTAGGMNLVLALYLKLVGKKNHSDALIASGEHVMSDVYTTGAALIGLGVVKMTNWVWLDSVIAILMAVFLFKTGLKVIRNSAGVLLDEASETTLDKLAEAFSQNHGDGLIDVHNVKMIRSGSSFHVDAHLVVPRFWDVYTAHERQKEFESKIIQSMGRDHGEIAFHLDPCEMHHCDRCDLSDCQIRKYDFKGHLPFSREQIILGDPITDRRPDGDHGMGVRKKHTGNPNAV